jgi:aspartyl-tRNA(Asn)/glutamyl-tRNA(Gln) amidotransferase subunit C
MKIDAALVTHVASLANLELSPDEVTHYEVQLGKIISHIEQINEMPDPLGAAFRSDTLGAATPERLDVVVPSLSPEEAMAAAPKKVGTAFQVPRIIE